MPDQARHDRLQSGRLALHLTRPPNRDFETSATCFDCCLSQEILDGVNGWLTT